MKRFSKFVSILLATSCVAASISLFGCSEQEETGHSLTVTGENLLYEDLNDSYKAGEEVTVKVKITPHKNTVAYLDFVPLVRSKSTQDEFLTFTFTMPNKTAELSIENKDRFDEAILTGFYLTFSKDGTPIESLNKELGSEEAVANYYVLYHDETLGDVYAMNDGAYVFADGSSFTQDTVYGLSTLELTDTLYYTYELFGAVASVDWVYFNEQTGNVSSSSGVGQTLDHSISTGLFKTQGLSDIRYDSYGKEYNATFNSKVKINFEPIDNLTGVKVLEYDKDNQLIKTTDFVGEDRLETYNAGAACEYVVIEEEYTVMEEGEHKGEKHCERTLINKSTYGDGKTLKYPNGKGLIAPIYLSVKWAE